MADEIRAVRVPRELFDRLVRPMELDLQALYSQLRDEVLGVLGRAIRDGRTEEQVIEEVVGMFDEDQEEDLAGLVRKALPAVKFQGIEIAVENRPGSVREGVDADGHPWRTTMKAPYGFIKRSKGVDGDEVDVFLGPDILSPWVYVVHIDNAEGEYDEDKVVLGCTSYDEAMRIVASHYDRPMTSRGADLFHVEDFKARLKEQRGDPLTEDMSRAALGIEKSLPIVATVAKSAIVVYKAGFPVGTWRHWRDGWHRKMEDGEWKKLAEAHEAPPFLDPANEYYDPNAKVEVGEGMKPILNDVRAIREAHKRGEPVDIRLNDLGKKIRRLISERSAAGAPDPFPKGFSPPKEKKEREPKKNDGDAEFKKQWNEDRMGLIQQVLDAREADGHPQNENIRDRYFNMEEAELKRKFDFYLKPRMLQAGDIAPDRPAGAPRAGRDPLARIRAKIGDLQKMRPADLLKLPEEDRKEHYRKVHEAGLGLWRVRRKIRNARALDPGERDRLAREVREFENRRERPELDAYLHDLRQRHPKKDWGNKPYAKRIEEDREAFLADVLSARAKNQRAPNVPADEERYRQFDDDRLIRRAEQWLGEGPVDSAERLRREERRRREDEERRAAAERDRQMREARRAEELAGRIRRQDRMKALVTGKGDDRVVDPAHSWLVDGEEPEGAERKPLGAGHINEVFKIKIRRPDGQEAAAVWKPQAGERQGAVRDRIPGGEQWKRERAGWLVGHLLGLNNGPACVIRELKDGVGACMEFIEDAEEYSGSGKGYGDIPKAEWQKVAVLDFLTWNTDRHGHNFMVKGDKLIAHDNGLAFPEDPYRDIYRSLPHAKLSEKGHRTLEPEVKALFTDEARDKIKAALTPFGFRDEYGKHFDRAWAYLSQRGEFPKAVDTGWGVLDVKWEDR